MNANGSMSAQDLGVIRANLGSGAGPVSRPDLPTVADALFGHAPILS